MAVGADEVQSTISGVRQEVGSIVTALDMLRIVLLHGINRLTTGHIDGHKDGLRLVWPPVELGVIRQAICGFHSASGYGTTVGILRQIADRTVLVELKALVAVE